jgi:hypothetical protein
LYESIAPFPANPGPANYDSYKSIAPSPVNPGRVNYDLYESVDPSPANPSTFLANPVSSGHFQLVEGHPSYFLNPDLQPVGPCPHQKSFDSIPPSKISNVDAISDLAACPPNVKASAASVLDNTIQFRDELETQAFIYKQPMESYWKDKNRLDA